MESSMDENANEWAVFDYEVWMFRKLKGRQQPLDLASQSDWAVTACVGFPG
jgi:hypothetical protein